MGMVQKWESVMMRSGTHGLLAKLLELGFSRCSKYAHDMQKLILIVTSSEERKTCDHLGKDTAAGPDIDGSAVSARAKKNVGGSIPECDNLEKSQC
jgi:hypothetical protein